MKWIVEADSIDDIVLGRYSILDKPLTECKDCKHRPIKIYDGIVPPKEDDWKCPCLCDDYFYSWIPEDNFFCANGERWEE